MTNIFMFSNSFYKNHWLMYNFASVTTIFKSTWIGVSISAKEGVDAKEKGITPEDFGMRLDAFFENLEPDRDYMTACQSGSAKRNNVQQRVKLMSKIIDAPPPLEQY